MEGRQQQEWKENEKMVLFPAIKLKNSLNQRKNLEMNSFSVLDLNLFIAKHHLKALNFT